MQTQKMSLANIKGKLSRAEMKSIMAGSGDNGTSCTQDSDCGQPHTINCNGTSVYVTPRCYANSGSTAKTCHVAGCPS